MYRQYDLSSGDHLTCWLEVDPRLRVGVKLTLKDDPDARQWEVVRIGSVHLTTPPDRRWRVGGLL